MTHRRNEPGDEAESWQRICARLTAPRGPARRVAGRDKQLRSEWTWNGWTREELSLAFGYEF